MQENNSTDMPMPKLHSCNCQAPLGQRCMNNLREQCFPLQDKVFTIL